MSNLNNHILSQDFKAGLFGKKPIRIDIFENGIKLKNKADEKEYLFTDISAIKSINYFEPNPPAYNVDIFDTDNNKIVSLTFPFESKESVTALLNTHKAAIKDDDFPDGFEKAKYIISHNLTWENGKLYHKWRKGVAEYTPAQIDRFVYENGMYYFTLKDSKDTIVVSLMDAPNCLLSFDICNKIAYKE